jgi:hypothetical protein
VRSAAATFRQSTAFSLFAPLNLKAHLGIATLFVMPCHGMHKALIFCSLSHTHKIKTHVHPPPHETKSSHTYSIPSSILLFSSQENKAYSYLCGTGGPVLYSCMWCSIVVTISLSLSHSFFLTGPTRQIDCMILLFLSYFMAAKY